MFIKPNRIVPASASSERVLSELSAVRLGSETLSPPLPTGPDALPLPARAAQQPVAPIGYQRSVQAWAQQIATVSRRAEAAEARVRDLEALLLKEASSKDSLGKHFGQHPRESFEDFVARLATVARVRRSLSRPADTPLLVDVVHLPESRAARTA